MESYGFMSAHRAQYLAKLKERGFVAELWVESTEIAPEVNRPRWGGEWFLFNDGTLWYDSNDSNVRGPFGDRIVRVEREATEFKIVTVHPL